MGQGRQRQPLVVPDASVLLKWVLPAEDEGHVTQAQALRQAFVDKDIALLLPPLWFYEVGNILTRRQPEDADARLRMLVNMAIPEAKPDPVWHEAICTLVNTHNVTFYDAAYHGLAIVENGVFITSDQKYLNKVGPEPHVRPLADWSTAC